MGELDRDLRSAMTIQDQVPNNPVGWILEGDILLLENDYSAVLTSYKNAKSVLAQHLVAERIATVENRSGDVDAATVLSQPCHHLRKTGPPLPVHWRNRACIESSAALLRA